VVIFAFGDVMKFQIGDYVLDEEQTAIVLNDAKYTLVVAGAGSGKTLTILGKLYYLVYENEKIVMLDKFEPMDILSEGHASELVTYKGVMVSKQHSDKDMFKINLLNMLDK